MPLAPCVTQRIYPVSNRDLLCIISLVTKVNGCDLEDCIVADQIHLSDMKVVYCVLELPENRITRTEGIISPNLAGLGINNAAAIWRWICTVPLPNLRIRSFPACSLSSVFVSGGKLNHRPNQTFPTDDRPDRAEKSRRTPH